MIKKILFRKKPKLDFPSIKYNLLYIVFVASVWVKQQKLLQRYRSANFSSNFILFINSVNDSDYKLRTLSRHLCHCDKIEMNPTASKKYGVNRRSVLLELEYFDLCSGTFIPDVMHDLLEGMLLWHNCYVMHTCNLGALQHEAKLVLRYCLRKNFFSYEVLADNMDSFSTL